MVNLRVRMVSSLSEKFDTWNWAWFFLCGYAVSFALSIALTQIFLIGFIVLIGIGVIGDGRSRGGLRGTLREEFSAFPPLWFFYSPLVLWVAINAVSSMLGLAPIHSLISLFKLSLYFLLPLFVYLLLNREQDGGIGKVRKLLIFFILSHGVAGLHTFVSSCLGYEIKPRVPGPLTESGQLELLFPVLFILPSIFDRTKLTKHYFVSVLFLACCWIFLAWLAPVKVAVLIALVGMLVLFVSPVKLLFPRKELLVLVCISLSLSALVLGLKRGPWFSILVEIAILVVSLFGLRSLSGLFLVVPLFFFSEVRDRIFSLSEHFFIVGGRFDMWKLGLELIERFPLGLGFGNSDLIRMFDSTLPVMHRHMHNNILNIFLECGLLGGVVFLIWVFRVMKMSWPIGLYICSGNIPVWSLLRGALVVSVIGWQLGGLVEYNFGDGEIRLFALVLLGVYLNSIKQSELLNA